MVLVGAQVRRFKSDAGGDKVLPACASFLDQLREFVSLASPPTNRVEPAAYTDAFRAAFNLFRTDNDTGTFIVWEVTSNPKNICFTFHHFKSTYSWTCSFSLARNINSSTGVFLPSSCVGCTVHTQSTNLYQPHCNIMNSCFFSSN